MVQELKEHKPELIEHESELKQHESEPKKHRKAPVWNSNNMIWNSKNMTAVSFLPPKLATPRADSTGVEHGEVGRLHQLKEHAADWRDKHQWQIGVTEMALGAACSPQVAERCCPDGRGLCRPQAEPWLGG
jgi:hypothetical protein